MFTTMKKTYIIPEMTAVQVAQCLPIAGSDPQVTVNTQGSVEAGDAEVKGNSQSYDVWDDDWSK